LILLTVLFAPFGCAEDSLIRRSRLATPEKTDSESVTQSSAGAVAGYPPLVRSIQPWEPPVDVGPAGQLLVTPHYRLHSTLEDGWLSEKIPAFLETALPHYRSAITDLPVPKEPLETYVLGERRQWQAFTRMILPGESGLYLSLGKGGYTTEGIAVLYDIGRWDTLCITAHEGWHQYCQNNFEETLPAWIDEGIATYMEGCRFDRSSEVATFMPWRNFERFNELRNCYRRGMMYPLFDLISRSPQYFLQQGQEHLLSYYAQVWVLTHYLMEGEGGRYRAGLERLLRDAQQGNLGTTLVQSPRLEEIPRRRRSSRAMRGLAVAMVYFDTTIEDMETGYRDFIELVVARGSGSSIWRGRSPVPDEVPASEVPVD
jgi:hypothetical protein